MPYINITQNFERPAEDYISTNWVHGKETNFFEKHVLARGGHLALTPWSMITSVADTIAGIGAGFASIATLGMHKATFKFAGNHLESSRTIVALPYANLLMTLNPSARFSGNVSHAAAILAARDIREVSNPLVSGDGDGFITHYVRGFLKGVARSCYRSDNFFKQHVAARLTYVLLAISSVVTRVADGIIGVIAASLSFLTLGKVESINNLAYRALQAPGIVNDFFYCTIKFINPWAGVSRE